MTVAARRLMAAMAALSCAHVSFAGPRLGFSHAECDFGELGPVETAERTIEVKNTSSVPVRILRVRACCGARAFMSAYENPISLTGTTVSPRRTPTSSGPMGRRMNVTSFMMTPLCCV